MKPIVPFLSSLSALSAVVVALAACDRPAPAATVESRVERGRYIVSAFGCADCHTPKRMGPRGPEPILDRSLSGHPEDMVLPPAPPASGPWVAHTDGSLTSWAGPWGTSFPANLTPDPETGLGTWTEDTFLATIRSGRHMGHGREILPPMPIEAIAHLTDDDLRSIFAYLRSLPPIPNRVPAPLPPAPAAPPAK